MALEGLYWSDDQLDQIGYLDSDLNTTILVSGLTSPQQLFFDTENNKIYFTDYHQVKRCNFDGSNIETLLDTGNIPAPSALSLFKGIAIDSVNDHLYCADTRHDRILIANLDGTNAQIIWQGSHPEGYGGERYMEIDPINEYIYWTDISQYSPDPTTSGLHRANYDGSNYTYVARAGNLYPGGNDNAMRFFGLFLDVTNQKMYWTSPNAGIIEASGLGGGISEIIISGLSNPLDLYVDIFDNKVYWSDLSVNRAISRANLDGTDIEMLVSGLGKPRSIFGYSSTISDIQDSGTLFICGEISVPVNISEIPLRIIHRLTRTGDYNPQLIGSFDSGLSSVNIQVWDVVDGINTQVVVTNSGCYAIGNTGKWGWSTEHLPFVSGYHNYHYYFEMISNTNDTDYGEFFLTMPEQGRWVYP